MIRAHRSSHRWIWRLLAVLLPALLVAALLVRADPPTNQHLPAGVETFSELEPER